MWPRNCTPCRCPFCWQWWLAWPRCASLTPQKRSEEKGVNTSFNWFHQSAHTCVWMYSPCLYHLRVGNGLPWWELQVRVNWSPSLNELVGKPDMVGASGGRRIWIVFESWMKICNSILFIPRLFKTESIVFFSATWMASRKKLFNAEQVTFIWGRFTATLILAKKHS